MLRYSAPPAARLASAKACLGLTHPLKPQVSRGCHSVSETRSVFLRWNFSKNIRCNWKNSTISFAFSYFLVFFWLELLPSTKIMLLSIRAHSTHTHRAICVCRPMLDAGVWGKPRPTVLYLSPPAYFGHSSCHITFQRLMQSQHQKKGQRLL